MFKNHDKTDQILEMYKNGIKLATIMEKTGACHTTILRIARRNGVGSRLGAKKAKIVELALSGMSKKEITAQVGCERNTTSRVMRACGL